jgi:AraC-like DNA-binding protein
MAGEHLGELPGSTCQARPSGQLRPGLPSLEHQLLADADAAIPLIAPVLHLRQLRPLVDQRDFYQEIGLLLINKVSLLSYVSAPAAISVDHTPAVQLVAAFAGGRVVRTATGMVSTTTGGGALLPPGASEVRGSDSSAVMTMRPEDLARTAAVIGGEEAAVGFGRFAPRPLSGLEARQLHALLQHLDACVHGDPALPTLLGLDDLLLRLVVSWLQPQLLQERPADQRRWRERGGGRSFNELLDYIRANLDHPLRLSDLEARSHYSSRALQYAFRQRLGCTPRQWIRQQRLEQAMARLEQGGRGCSVRAVALACGYQHMGLFSSDFKKRFGLTPSAARRASEGGGGGVVLVQAYDLVVNRGQSPPPPCSAERPLVRPRRGVALPR